jgi:hypothetical protein
VVLRRIVQVKVFHPGLSRRVEWREMRGRSRSHVTLFFILVGVPTSFSESSIVFHLNGLVWARWRRRGGAGSQGKKKFTDLALAERPTACYGWGGSMPWVKFSC